MALRLNPPVEKTFLLEETNKNYESEGTSVTIRQASQGQFEKRQDLFAEMTSKFTNDPGLVEVVQRFSIPELHRIEAYLTLVDCNIEDEDGGLLFRISKDNKGHSYLNMTEKEFERAWAKLPVDVAAEIHEKVLEMNPTWGSRGE